MDLLSHIKNLAIIAPIFLALDMLWILVIANQFYLKELGSYARKTGDALGANLPAAVAVYIVMLLAVYFFALKLDPKSMSLSEATLRGAALGVAMYGTYALTAYAVITNWSLKMTLADIAWGAFICAAVSGISTLIIKQVF